MTKIFTLHRKIRTGEPTPVAQGRSFATESDLAPEGSKVGVGGEGVPARVTTFTQKVGKEVI